MSAIGLVHIPGMMTGQILAGIEPLEAVKYQMLIMVLIDYRRLERLALPQSEDIALAAKDVCYAG